VQVNLVLALVCHDYLKKHPSLSNPNRVFSLEPGDECRLPEIQTAVATFKLCISILSGVLAAIIAPKVGALSDRYGRTRMLAYVNSGQILNEFITILAARFPDTVPYQWLLLGAFFDGLAGSFISSQAIAHSYAADCTPASSRNVIFGYFHGLLFTGIAIGPALAGYIIKITGDIISMFYIASSCHILFFLLLIFVIPESVPRSRQRTAREKYRRESLAQGNPSWKTKLRNFNVLEPLKILYAPNSPPEVRRNLILLAATETIVSGVGMGAAVVILLYSNYRFGWNIWQQAKFTSIVNSCRVANLIVILPLVTKIYRSRFPPAHSRPLSPGPTALEGTDSFELSVIRFAILADSVGFLSYGLSASGTSFTLSGAIASIGGIGSPTMQAALTKHVPKESIGQLLGAMGLLHAIARIIGPTLFMGIYAVTVKSFPQAYFFIITLMFGLGFGVSLFVRPGRWRSNDARYRD
jgi:MFS family permease